MEEENICEICGYECVHMKKLDDPFVLDKASGHLFCKHCGENYLNKKHKPECPYYKDTK